MDLHHRHAHVLQLGPIDPQGVMLDQSDRPALCMSVNDTEVVVGSSDHALYTFDLTNGRKLRTLYSKQFGHKEWVTCVAHIPCDGRIVSGGSYAINTCTNMLVQAPTRNRTKLCMCAQGWTRSYAFGTKPGRDVST